MAGTTVCALCGTPVPPGTPQGQVPLGWALGTERGRTTATCERCTRENARSIEAKLDPEWW